jgi:FkbM family methyltransferase
VGKVKLQKILKYFFRKVLKLVIKLISKINQKLILIFEIELKRTQGKGIGANTLKLEVDQALKFLNIMGINSPVLVDIGANVGNYTSEFMGASPKSKIFAFEPSKLNLQILEKKFEHEKQVKILPFALSNFTGKAELFSDLPGSGLASLTKRDLRHLGINFDSSESIDVITLDEWLKNSGVIPHMIKLDVEGHELDVLKGGIEALKVVKVVQFEFGGCNLDTRTFFKDIWDVLNRIKFKIYRISPIGPILLPRYSEEDEYFLTTNYLAVKETIY